MAEDESLRDCTGVREGHTKPAVPEQTGISSKQCERNTIDDHCDTMLG